jgi:hypothetical protein
VSTFREEDIHTYPDRLWEQGVWEYVVQPDGLSGPGWVHLSVAARERLGDRDRAWIADHLNAQAAHTSYGVTCANLLRKVLVPDPPAVVADEDEITTLARELYAQDPDSSLRAADVPFEDLSPWERRKYVDVARWEHGRQRRRGY